MVTPREQLQQSQYAQGYRRRRRGTSALLSRSVVGRSLLASAMCMPDRSPQGGTVWVAGSSENSRSWGLCSNGTETWEVHATHPGHRDPGADAVHPAPQTLATRTSTVLGS